METLNIAAIAATEIKDVETEANSDLLAIIELNANQLALVGGGAFSASYL